METVVRERNSFESLVMNSHESDQDIVLLFVIISEIEEAEVIEEVFGILKKHRPDVAKNIAEKMINFGRLGD
jgi:hypothetical protein